MTILLTTLGFDMQLFLLLEADDKHCLSSEELSAAVVSWLTMSEVHAAHAVWQRHSKLTLQMTTKQQQKAFQAALNMLQHQPDTTAVVMARDCCLLAASLRLPGNSQQLQQLVDVLLADHQNQEAYTVNFGSLLSYCMSTCRPNMLYQYLQFYFCKTSSGMLTLKLHYMSRTHLLNVQGALQCRTVS